MRKIGGWWRLWIVLTVLLMAFFTMIGLGQRESYSEGEVPLACVPGTLEREIVSVPTISAWEAYQKTPQNMLERGEIIDPRKDIERYHCVVWRNILSAWVLGISIAFSVLVAVFALRWIYAGFKRPRQP